jgi:hypothetical protein
MNRSLYRASTKTPGYRSIIEAGGTLPDNPLTFQKKDGGHLLGGTAIYSSHSANGDYVEERRDAILTNTYVAPWLSDPFTMSMHAPKLLNRAKGCQWSAPVFFAEAGKTAEMIATSATRIYKMFRALKSGSFYTFYNLWSRRDPAARDWSTRRLKRASASFAKSFGHNPRMAVSSAWLEYKYGWMPFVLDSYNAMETLHELRNKPQSHVGRVTNTLRDTKRSTIRSTDRITSIAGVLVGGQIDLTYELSSKASWRFSTRGTDDVIGKLGLTNPLLVGWELVPLSFVADWFLPIGDYLASLDAPLRFNHLGGTIGFKQIVTGFTAINESNGAWRLFPVVFKTASGVRVIVKPMMSIPSTKLSEFSFFPDLGHGRAISAIALLSQAFKRFRRLNV